jgi:hypothetical protein
VADDGPPHQLPLSQHHPPLLPLPLLLLPLPPPSLHRLLRLLVHLLLLPLSRRLAQYRCRWKVLLGSRLL